MTNIIDGKAMARAIRASLMDEIREKHIKATLAVVLVGEDPGSKIYVNSKEKAAKEIGIGSIIHRLPNDTSQDELSKLIEKLNADSGIDGILVQLPLPKHLDESQILEIISPKKDVDGIHQVNMGRLILGMEPYHYPCTAAGIMELIRSTKTVLKGKNAVVIGRSNIVGKPIAQLLLREHVTVTMCHSRTQNIEFFSKNADILVVAIGKDRFVGDEMVKKGAVVIDVGMNRTDKGLFGDVDFEKVKNKASFITPVPGGVGPMTIAMLMQNCVRAATMK
ncbi:MAG: tetrahydrofolate dehydrogenase/cyclohydrolase catalytic domain-containing protein [Candidatus Margulisiibacteriota bacterium]